MAALQQVLMALKAATSAVVGVWYKVFSREAATYIAWLNNQSIAVGVYGSIRTSPDGYTWTTQAPELGISSTLNGVTWTGVNYVVVGNNSVVLTSPDSVIWTSRAYGVPSLNINSVASNGSITVAGASTGAIRTSTDGGSIWDSQASNGMTNLTKILWNGSMFIAAGGTGSGNIQIATSADGLTWVLRTCPFAWVMNDICWTGTNFVISATNTAGAVGQKCWSITSPDGITWTSHNTASSLTGTFGIVSAGGTVVMTLNGGTVVSVNDGVSWSSASTAITTMYMCWDGSKIISATTSGQTALSYDGLTWTTSLSEPNAPAGILSSNFNLNSLAYVNSTYIIGTFNSRVFSSTDGENWNSGRFITAPASANFTCVGGSSSFYVAAGAAGMLYTSPDANTWTVRTSGAGANQINAVANNGTITVIVGGAGTKRYSTDGVTWTAGTGATTATAINAVIWADGRFVAIGDNYVAVSTDGMAWTAGSLTLSATKSLIWNSTYSVYVAGGSAGAIRTSANGTTWTAQTPINANAVSTLATNGSRIVALSGAASVTTGAYSDNGGVSWSIFNMPTMQVFSNAVYNGSTYFATSPNNVSMLSSTDGITWSNVEKYLFTTQTRIAVLGANNYLTSTGQNNSLSQGHVLSTTDGGEMWNWHLVKQSAYIFDVNYNGTQYVAVGGATASNARAYTSPDLITWTERTVTGPTTNFKSIAYSGSTYVASTNNGGATTIPPNGTAGSLWSSADGVTWTSRSTSAPFYTVKWHGSKFVAVAFNTTGSSGTIWTSPEGTSWTQVYSLAGANMVDSAYSGTNYVVVAAGTTNKIFTSPDGVTWTPRMTSAIPALDKIAYGNGVFMATASSGGNAYISEDDGITWALISSNTSSVLSTIAWDVDRFVAFSSVRSALLTYIP